ncbi:MAG: hypothetical protein KDF58_13770 [Alphaproteobacteria bacterium]|nr:hypothetical protein [Alphaproteobacteria bacterium]
METEILWHMKKTEKGGKSQKKSDEVLPQKEKALTISNAINNLIKN